MFSTPVKLVEPLGTADAADPQVVGMVLEHQAKTRLELGDRAAHGERGRWGGAVGVNSRVLRPAVFSARATIDQVGA
jgi:hypothetical protein